MARFIEKQYKSILNKQKFIDGWFWTQYSINPYNGCMFGCVYCDARSDHYHMPEDFENEIVIKQDVGKMLDQRLSRARTLLPDVVGMGGVTDSYQAAERKFGNSRQILEVLAKHQYPVHLFTKSTWVTKDLDLLEEIAQQTWSTVSITITTMDADIASFLDKRAPSPQKRLATLTEIKEKAPHVQAGVLFMPLVPFLADSSEAFKAMVFESKAAGADYMLFGGGMTLRNKQALWFLQNLKERYPELIKPYSKLYRFTVGADEYNGRYYPSSSYFKPKHRQLLALCEAAQLPHRIKRFIPNDYRRTNYLIAEQLLNEAYRQQMVGKPYENLHWAGQNIQNLKEPIEEIAARGELTTIRNVRGPILEKVNHLLYEFAS